MSSKNFYDKHAEHQDKTSLGKLRSKYWTTKQLVIKKLGREQDEFVIASDADVDAKLDLLYTIKRSCHDLLHVCTFSIFKLFHPIRFCFHLDYEQQYQTNVLIPLS